MIGFSYSAVVISSTSIILDISDETNYGGGMGILNTARSVGEITGPFMAFLLINVRYAFTFQILGIFPLISSIILIVFQKKIKKIIHTGLGL